MIFGITGTDGAGKGTAVDYLVKEKSFTHYHVRSLLLKEIEAEGLEPTRANMRLVANKLRAEHGDDYVVRLFLEEAHKHNTKNCIIDSLRTLAEAARLREMGGILLAVDADQMLRYERVQRRQSESDHVTFEEFKAHEDLEANDPDPHGMQKMKVVAAADYTLHNNGTIEELHAQIDRALGQIERG